MLSTIIFTVEIVLAIVLIAVILLQHKGAGLGAGFGGSGGGPIVTTRRGVDLFLHKVTIVVSVLFFALGIGLLFIA